MDQGSAMIHQSSYDVHDRGPLGLARIGAGLLGIGAAASEASDRVLIFRGRGIPHATERPLTSHLMSRPFNIQGIPASISEYHRAGRAPSEVPER